MSRTKLTRTYSVSEAARELKCSEEFLRRKIREGEVKAIKPFRHYVILHEEILRLLGKRNGNN